MNISNLIEKLIAERLEHGDLEVTVWADHGQTNTLAHNVGVQYRDKDGEIIAHEDLEQYQDEPDCNPYTAVMEIS
jgi:hypothetical protein